ncbi:hydantoinase/carbamoylase family amidase [Microvirga massiliensis]|uniref:hydantoinase/carbamoylase family amidase n=1 Tax=Microvirga massiliensis TaxID=1033741 RepID=UPI00062BA3D3|nr:hydantoinase/carbamoylase family amidase [Microvirga massiliensis]
MIEIDGNRLLQDLRRLAEFGKYSTGVDRTALSEPDLAARRWLSMRLEEAGLEARLDRFGTVYGRAPGAGRAVLIGSHTDSVPKGGWLDGALGVIYGLEIARAATAAGVGPVDVVSFQDEEGTFVPCLGSKSFCGTLKQADVETAVSADGRRLRDVLRDADLPPAEVRLDAGRYAAFLEAHIEQGPRLEASGQGIGIVTGIVGIRRFRISARGQADHAGTTPMNMRRDAGAALLRLSLVLLDGMPRWAEPESVWNIGVVEFRPGAANVVPAEASLVFEFRDLEPAVLRRIEAEVRQAVRTAGQASGIDFTVESIGGVDPVSMDAHLQSLLRDAADELGEEFMVMPSGAGHDAMVMARAIPSIMLFVPSIGGRSHDIAENTSDADIIRGCRVMARAVGKLFEAGQGV